jgi:hypothetical protein
VHFGCGTNQQVKSFAKFQRIYTWAAYATYKHYAQHVPDIVRFRRTVKRRMRRSAQKM